MVSCAISKVRWRRGCWRVGGCREFLFVARYDVLYRRWQRWFWRDRVAILQNWVRCVAITVNRCITAQRSTVNYITAQRSTVNDYYHTALQHDCALEMTLMKVLPDPSLFF